MREVLGDIEAKEISSIPETLAGEKTAELAKQLFDKISFRTASKLVDSNVALALAGFKPHTEFSVDVPTDEGLKAVREDVKALNHLLEKLNANIQLGASEKTTDRLVDGRTGEHVRSQMISVQNLLGYERMSKTTNMPGVTPYDRGSGWQGLKEWGKQVRENAKRAQAEGKIPYKNLDSVLQGLSKGYPDRAIFDFSDWLESGRKNKTQNSRIPYTGLYGEAQPNFYFYPEHADDQSIKENIAQAGTILHDFYKSNWHKSVAPDLISRRTWRWDEVEAELKK